MREYLKLFRMVLTFGQLGFTLITPPMVLALLGWWLQDRFDLGPWVVLVAIVVGLVTAGTSAVQFFRRIQSARKREEPEEGPRPTVFNTHE